MFLADADGMRGLRGGAARRGVCGAGVQVNAGFIEQDDYVYYPDYQMYYGSRSHRWYDREGSSWVARPEPREVSVDVLRSSPSVRMDFHDSPAITTRKWFRSILEIGRRPARIRARKIIGRKTGMTMAGKSQQITSEPRSHIERNIMFGTILLIVLILMLLGALPTWPHSRSWGYYPSSGLGLLLAFWWS